MVTSARKIMQIDLGIDWIVPKANQGQAIEISYSSAIDEDGYGWRKIYDRSDLSVELSRVAFEDVLGVWDPFNGEPRAKSWDVLEVKE